ncbi:MAG: hypothetical protein OEV35_09755 [Gallionellaceae bacterium]|nr:hypothetical protein [Gallionellaceae bacterium]
MQGTRLFYEPGEEDFVWRIASTPGAYGSRNGKDWYGTTPNGLLGTLTKHTVIEHEDGTITVSPSILVTSGSNQGQPSWHGFLERGVWREC